MPAFKRPLVVAVGLSAVGVVFGSGCAWFRKKVDPLPTALSSLSRSTVGCGLEGPIEERKASCKTKWNDWILVTRDPQSGFEVWLEPTPGMPDGPPPPRYWTSTFGRVMPLEDARSTCKTLYHASLPIELNWHLPTQLDWKQATELGLLRLGRQVEEVRPSWNWYWTATDGAEPKLDWSEMEVLAVHRQTGIVSRKAKGPWNLGLLRCVSGLALVPVVSESPPVEQP